MFITNIWSLEANDRSLLSNLIYQYATDEIVAQHYLGNGAHGMCEGGGLAFFEWHRNYLRGLENFLRLRLGARPATVPVRVAIAASSRPRPAIAPRPSLGLSVNLTRNGSILPFWEPWSELPPEFTI